MHFPRIRDNSQSGRALTSSPSTRMAPEVGRRMQPSMESSVDLPEPDGPVISAIWPLFTVNDTESTATKETSPSRYRFDASLASSMTLISTPEDDRRIQCSDPAD